ncbi:hypothetical protein DJ018_10730 [Phenylobacterium deserti]|uniref:Phytase-like domain-containing protein n=1 Tax=Phenylobacterium deserti TaxID=1914756 RepID=A0A328AEN0_9CAUL|nr:hypothetical protein DJ018_10730 [Phenylobacterium deserti]
MRWARLGLSLAISLVASAGWAQPFVRLEARLALGPGVGEPPFGGISGADYDRRSGTWVLISDDKSEHGPARLYAASMRLAAGVVRFEPGPWTALRPSVGDFGPPGSGKEAPDGEAVRLDPRGGLVWASEGDPDHGRPARIRRSGADGAVREAPLPRQFRFDPSGRRGPRRNAVIEGLSWSADGRDLWVSLEGPLIEDGPPASSDQGAMVRLSRLSRHGRVLAQYAYPIDRAAERPPAGRNADNGVSEILAVDAHRLLVLERSGVQGPSGRYTFHIRLYLADVSQADDVRRRRALAGPVVRSVRKTLLLNFDELEGPGVGNLEAMAWGPRLVDGAPSLILFSDNNFEVGTPTRLVVLRFGNCAPGRIDRNVRRRSPPWDVPRQQRTTPRDRVRSCPPATGGRSRGPAQAASGSTQTDDGRVTGSLQIDATERADEPGGVASIPVRTGPPRRSEQLRRPGAAVTRSADPLLRAPPGPFVRARGDGPGALPAPASPPRPDRAGQRRRLCLRSRGEPLP